MEKARSADGTVIAYDRTGEGPPLVLVGGALGDRSAAAPLARLLGADFTVFAYDRRGRGSSTDAPSYAVDREIEDLAAVIEASGGAAFVHGVSSGAILALEAASRGLPIERLAVYEPPYTGAGGRALAADLAARLRKQVADGRPGDAVELFLTEAVQVPSEAVAQLRASPYWTYMQDLAHTLPYDVAIVGDGAVPAERFAALAVPALAIDGGASPQWARDAVRAVADALPAGRRVSLPDQNHDVRPEALAPVLRDFFVG